MKTKNSICSISSRVLVTLALPAFIWMLISQTTQAGSATWLTNPVSSDWNDASNWSTGGPPNGSTDIATFNTSSITTLSFSAFTTVDGIVYNPGASAYTTTTSILDRLFFVGVGITNNFGITQQFVTDVIGGQGAFSSTVARRLEPRRV